MVWYLNFLNSFYYSSYVVLTEEECFVLYFDKISWDNLIRDIYDKQKKFNHTVICSSEIFYHYINQKFTYYNSFKIKQIETKALLIQEGGSPEYIYFIKQGEFEVTINRSILELTEILVNLGGKDWNKELRSYQRLLSNNGII